MSIGRPLKVDMESILDAMTHGPSEPGEQLLNTENREVVVLFEAGFDSEGGDLREEIDGAPRGHFEQIPRTRAEYDWMRDFTATVDDDELRSRLEDALAGRGAFRLFRDIVFRDGELRSRWLHTRRDALVREATAWLESIGIAPTFELYPIDPPVAPQPRKGQAIQLLDLILLGAHDGTTELLDGIVPSFHHYE